MYTIQIMLSVTLLLPTLVMGAAAGKATIFGVSVPGLRKTVSYLTSSPRRHVDDELRGGTFEKTYPTMAERVRVLNDGLNDVREKSESEQNRQKETLFLLEHADRLGVEVCGYTREGLEKTAKENVLANQQILAILAKSKEIGSPRESNPVIDRKSSISHRSQEELKDGEGAYDEI
jgi:hypothetical protein